MSIINNDRLVEVSMNDQEFLKELLQATIQSSLDEIKKIEQAQISLDFDLCRERAHALKGVALNIGAEDLAEAASRYQKVFEEKDLSHILEYFQALGSEVENLRHEGRKYDVD